MKNPKTNVLEIKMNLPLYRRHVVLAIGHTPRMLREAASDMGLGDLTSEWWAKVDGALSDAKGITTNFGDGNSDILIWLRKTPVEFDEYGTLYHELYHAVELIASQIDPNHLMNDNEGMSEARAYLYEYLATECNRTLWTRNVAGASKAKKKKV